MVAGSGRRHNVLHTHVAIGAFMILTIITHVIALIVGGAGGYLWGAKVKAKAAAVEAAVKS